VIPSIFVTHLAVLTIPWLEFSWAVVGVHFACVAVVGFGVTIGYHRYFSHRAFKTSRVVQFVLGWLACLSTQRGPLWWASHHRRHHAHSDGEHDVHSPDRHGLWYAHMGWLFDPDKLDADYRTVRDFTKYPELVLLDWLWWVPPLTMVGLMYALGSWPFVVTGYLLSVVTVKHVTFAVNSIGHVHGPQPYDTRDTSRNNWVLGYLALGDGWHNNHHHSPRTARHGFKWFELDATYWVILLLEKLRLVWDVKKTPRPARSTPAVVG
jgi:stearoyl-CoA desaturase (delta-9 desaturase)